ncbi:MAG TPA: SGNH/GDSL hydrolase family protein [Acetobacteraceae bacterium]|nr:SGNH/GDSL hydrolase family protein [Acetobacteraceae bacterium]
MSLINAASLGLSAAPSFISNSFDGLLRLLGLQGASSPAAGTPFSVLYAFGDSLSGAGNDYVLSLGKIPVSPPYSDGRFTDGPVWVQDLADSLRLPAVTASLRGGSDFAYGSAETGATPLHAEAPIDLPSQLSQFNLANPKPQADALYTLSIGNNDVLDSISAFPTDTATALVNIADAAENETKFILSLIGDGARNLAVLNVPDLGKTPRATSLGTGAVQVASYLAALYDQQLNGALRPLFGAVNLHVIDTFPLLDAAIANPGAYGLTNVTDPLWTGNYTDPSSGTLQATGAAASGYLFFDSIHPTAHGHALLAAAAQASLA